MYIEYTPLEGHLKTILRHPATAAALLGHAGVQESVAASDETYNRDTTYNRPPVSTESVPNLEELTIKAHRLLSSANNNSKPGQLPNNFLEVEEDDCEEYELIDVIDSEEDRQNESAQSPKLRTPSKAQFIAKEQEFEISKQENQPLDLPNNNCRNNFVIELEDENFAYVVTTIPNKESFRKSLDNRDPRFAQKTNVDYSSSYPRLSHRNSLPALRPITGTESLTLNTSCKSSSYILRQTKSSSGLKLLNGNLHKFYRSSSSLDSNCSSQSSYIYVPRTSRRNSNIFGRYYNNGLTAAGHVEEEDEEDDDFDYIESTVEGNQNSAFCIADTFEERAPSTSQMGMDILNKLRKLLNINSGAKYNDSNEDSKRKRRCDDWTTDAVDAHQIKYRKVDNHFPKFITGRLDDDDLDCFPYPRRPRKPLLLQQHHHHRIDDYPAVAMSDCRSLESPRDKSKQRRSIFAPPRTTRRLVKNIAYADLEFSDDDEPELVNGFGGHSGSRHNAPKVYNIPITYRDERHEEFSSPKSPTPPRLLNESRTGGNYLASSLLPELKRPTYADTLKQNMTVGPSSGGHMLGVRETAAAAPSSSAVPRYSYTGLADTVHKNPWGITSRSILTQEKESEEREKYQELLKQLVPRIYGADENTTAAAAAPFKATKAARKRSSLLASVAAANGSPSPSVNNTFAMPQQHYFVQQQPLSSTINLDEDDDDDLKMLPRECESDLKFAGSGFGEQAKVASRKKSNAAGIATALVIDDDDINEFVDLGEDEEERAEARSSKPQIDLTRESQTERENKQCENELPHVEPVNSLKLQFSTSPHLKENWLQNWQSRWEKKRSERKIETQKFEAEAQKHTEARRTAENELRERLKNFQIFSPELVIIDDFPEPVKEKEPELVQFTADHQARIKSAIAGAPDQVLVSKFNLNITRRDIHTLLGHNWLNDEVINFYMNLITDRGEKRADLPNAYAMNTFFIPRLMQAGYSGVKRWTRKVDIFAKDVIPVPVHVGGVHWCMAIIHLKQQSIKYYDSMATPNPSVLKALEQYLKDESMDKRKQPFDTSDFQIESVADVPRQMNGSDCGVFSCMFAEFVTRNKDISFSQQHMEYFRQKMVLEIVRGELLQ